MVNRSENFRLIEKMKSTIGCQLFRHRFILAIVILLAVGFICLLNTSSDRLFLGSSPAAQTGGALRQASVSSNVNRYSKPFDIRVFKPTEFNLLEGTDDALSTYTNDQCNLEWINLNKLQQDHPCVIETIRTRYLHPPADPGVPYVLQAPNISDPSAGQAKSILKYLGNQTQGFFVECGALDGEHLSNTLYMERTMQWNGLLIEADLTSFGKLLSRRRKSYALPVCLSLQPYATQVIFKVVYAVGSIQEKQNPDMFQGSSPTNPNLVTVQCFPLYSILLAVGQTRVDFFSLDVEGHELRILATIPWHKVDIKTLSVEWDHVGEKALVDFMEPRGYYLFGRNEGTSVGADLFFARNDSRPFTGFTD